MERSSDPIGAPPRPPKLAEWLLGAIAAKRERAALLGDLAEEFADRSSRSAAQARHWYWLQVLRSSPHLIAARARSSDALRRCLIGALMMFAIGFLVAWDLIVSRPTVYWIATQDQAPALIIVRLAYFAIQIVGTLIGGAAIALTLFDARRPFWRNATLYLGPVMVALIVLSCLSALERGLVRSSSYLLLRNGLSMLALLGAAALSTAFMRRRL